MDPYLGTPPIKSPHLTAEQFAEWQRQIASPNHGAVGSDLKVFGDHGTGRFVDPSPLAVQPPDVVTRNQVGTQQHAMAMRERDAASLDAHGQFVKGWARRYQTPFETSADPHRDERY